MRWYLGSCLRFGFGAMLAGMPLMVSEVRAERVRVLAGGAAQPVLRALAPDLASRLAEPPDLVFGVVGALQQRLAGGEKADVVLLPVPLLTALEQSGKVAFVRRQTLARVGISVVVKSGVDAPDIASADAVRRLLAKSKAVVHSDPKVTPGGAHMTKVLTDLGVTGGLQVLHRNAIDGGVDMVARGEADVGFFLVTEVLPVPGIKLVGLLPDALQSWVVYGIGVVAGSGKETVAADLAAYLASPEVAPRWRGAGFELVAR